MFIRIKNNTKSLYIYLACEMDLNQYKMEVLEKQVNCDETALFATYYCCSHYASGCNSILNVCCSRNK